MANWQIVYIQVKACVLLKPKLDLPWEDRLDQCSCRSRPTKDLGLMGWLKAWNYMGSKVLAYLSHESKLMYSKALAYLSHESCIFCYTRYRKKPTF